MDLIKSLKEKIIAISLIILFMLGLFIFYSFYVSADQKVIVIQPGHSVGYDSGAVSNVIEEAQLNELVSLKLLNLLEQRGYIVYITHTSNPDYSDRTLLSNEHADTLRNVGPACNNVSPDFAISIHHNSGGATSSGYELYWSSYRDYDNEGVYTDRSLWSGSGGLKDSSPSDEAIQSERFANILNYHMNGIPNLYSRGIYERDDYLPAHAGCPCILYEGGYLSNQTEAAYLATETYQDEAALRIADAIDDFFGNTKPPTEVSLSLSDLNMQVGQQATIDAVALPTNSSAITFNWESSDPDIVTVEDGVVTAISSGTAQIKVSPEDDPNTSATCKVTVYPNYDYQVEYTVKSEDYGSITGSNGVYAGTVGVAKKITDFTVALKDAEGLDVAPELLGISYKGYEENAGWIEQVADEALSESDNENDSLIIEAIKIELTGSEAQNYNIYYRTHIADYGWTSYSNDGEASGSEGYNKPIEAIDVIILPIDTENLPDMSEDYKFYSAYGDGLVRYSAHISSLGWQDYVSDEQIAGIEGLDLEAIKIVLNPNLADGSIETVAHVANTGWLEPVIATEAIGTTGNSAPIEALRMKLNGEVAEIYDLNYQVYVKELGWMDSVMNDQIAGTEGQGLPIQAIKIWLTEK